MKNPNLSQINLLIQNNNDIKIHRLIEKEDLLVCLINHLIELFTQSNHLFKILEPLLDLEFEPQQQTTLALDGIEIGDLCLLSNSFYEGASLVYYSPSGFLEVNIIEFDEFNELKLSDYLVLLHEFSSVLYGQFLLYKKIK